MSARLQKNGTWTSQFRCKDRDGNDVHKCKRGFATQAEADAWEAETRATLLCSMAMSFEEFMKVYESDVRPRIREHTWITKEYIIKDKLIPHFGHMKMNEITKTDIVRWQNELMTTKKSNGKSYAPTYLRTVNNQLTAIFNHACRFYGLNPNPAVLTIKMGSKDAGEMQFWTKEEYLKFSEALMERPRAYMMFEILYWTGIREGELLALTPADFNFEKLELRITKSYQRLNGQDVITDPKTPKSIRTIKMPQFLADEVYHYISQMKGLAANERLFPVTKGVVSRERDHGCAVSGVKRIRIHDIRHSHVSLLIDMGFSAVAIAQRMGHESIDITYRYAHLFPSIQNEMANALDSGRKVF
jgi:integrase